jgi:YHS domain-containing protein
MKRLLLAAFFSAAASFAWAGPQYIDNTGFAVSGYDVVAYFSLPQTQIGTPQSQAIPGNANITAEHNGETFAFSSAANRELFTANPDKYINTRIQIAAVTYPNSLKAVCVTSKINDIVLTPKTGLL